MDRVWVYLVMFIMGVLAILYMDGKISKPIQLVNWIPAPLYSILFTVVAFIIGFGIFYVIIMRLVD